MVNPNKKPCLAVLPPSEAIHFQLPRKRINDGEDVSFWLHSKAYSDIMTFLFQLNMAMFPRSTQHNPPPSTQASHSVTALSLGKAIEELASYIDEAPPDPGPRRFGNTSFRTWHGIVESRITALLDKHLPRLVLDARPAHGSEATAVEELKSYLLGSFGSAQRLDYGTGHELSFLAFIAAIWKLGGFTSPDGDGTESSIVLEVISPYLDLVRKLIKTYNLEPAGSHGVWGLDDHSFLPYIFGSAQLSPLLPPDAVAVLQEGSAPDAPNPSEVVKKDVVDDQRGKNLYFGAIGFINDVKKGPFWEHSPMLYDISGVTTGWAKINKGMLKMYNVEVLSKFPVVQHFPFGGLFQWELDPHAEGQQPSVHLQNQSKQATVSTQEKAQAPFQSQRTSNTTVPPTRRPGSAKARIAMHTAAAPWARPEQTQTGFVTGTTGLPATAAPWAQHTSTQTGRGGEQLFRMSPTAPSRAIHSPSRNDNAQPVQQPTVRSHESDSARNTE